MLAPPPLEALARTIEYLAQGTALFVMTTRPAIHTVEELSTCASAKV